MSQHSGAADDSVRYFGSARHLVPRQVANPTIPGTSATGSLDHDPLGRPDHHLTRARAHSHLHCKQQCK